MVFHPEIFYEKLLKVFNSGLEHTDIVVSGDVGVTAGAEALAVTHLAEDTAVGRSDTFDGEQGAVGVEGGIHGGVAFQIYVLGSDLTVLCQLQSQLFGC